MFRDARLLKFSTIVSAEAKFTIIAIEYYITIPVVRLEDKLVLYI